MKTILVVEDDASIMSLVRLIVESNGYTMLAASSVEEAFERFEENDEQVDLLIADVTLPVNSGIRVALELRSLHPYLKIIITSGYPPAMWDEEDAAKLHEIPTDSVVTLQKPFVPATLLECVHRLIGLPFKTAPALQAKTAT